MSNKLVVEAGKLEAGSSPTKFLIRIIEGDRWGSTGYYPARVLETDGPKVFRAGTHMFLNHPTMSDEYEIPERRVEDIVGVLSTDAVYDPDTKSLLAEATVFSDYGEAIRERMEHIGVSIRAFATIEYGVAEGVDGDIITSFVGAESVDFVTRAGAGGALIQALESARSNRFESRERPRAVSAAPASLKEEAAMAEITPDQFNTLVEAMTNLVDRLNKEADVRAEAAKPVAQDPMDVAAAVTESGLPKAAHPLVFAAVKGGAPVADAIEAAQKHVQSIIEEARPNSIGAPQTVTQLNDIPADRLAAALMGK